VAVHAETSTSIAPIPAPWGFPGQFCFRCEGKLIVHFHDHEHPRTEQINLKVLDAGILHALGDFRPNPFMMPPILSD
jgi:hypothetical protein